MVDHKNDESEEVEQGFNDSELEDIMSEIEALENEFSAQDEELGAEVVSLNAESPEKKTPKKPVEAKKPIKSSKPVEAPVALEFKVSGDMLINLKFWIDGEWAQVTASGSEGLVVEVEGGAKFCLPLKRAS